MPSPFPGMDPFLEDPAVFPDLHDSFIAYLREALNSGLPAGYYAATNSRVWIEPARHRIGPDVNVLKREGPSNGGIPVGGGGTAIADLVATEPVIVHVAKEEARESYLEIFSQNGKHRLVATIEMLSRANKTPGEKGRGLYRKKQRAVLRRRVHLIEIDLLRAGKHTTAVPLDAAMQNTGGFDYHVCVRRFNRPQDYSVYPIHLPQRLPTLAVPLLPDDPSVQVDLQATIERCYATGRYDMRVNYRESVPPPALSAEQQAWADQILHSRIAAEDGSAPPAT
jgi:hypothetical protein